MFDFNSYPFERKLKHLKDHIRAMMEQGMIREHTEYGRRLYTSPVHIVLEERYVASERRNVFKSRFTQDWRQVNTMIEPSANPLPLCDEFRRSVAREGYSVFSNLDAASFYYQFPLETGNNAPLFGFEAFGRLYVLVRLPMGCSLEWLLLGLSAG